MVDTSDEWIVRRTGIRERRIAASTEFTSTLCIEAAHLFGYGLQNRLLITLAVKEAAPLSASARRRHPRGPKSNNAKQRSRNQRRIAISGPKQ